MNRPRLPATRKDESTTLRIYYERIFQALLGKRMPPRCGLVKLGMYGFLAAVLNDGVVPHPDFPGTSKLVDVFARLLARQRGWKGNLGQKLAAIFEKQGWKGLQAAFVLAPRPDAPEPDRAWRFAVLESLLFERARFRIRMCEKSGHRFVSDDPRRTDCLIHRRAGQQARFRLNRRCRTVLEHLGRDGMTLQELRRIVHVTETDVRVRGKVVRRTMRLETLKTTVQELVRRGGVMTRTDSKGQKLFYRSASTGGE